MNLAHVSFLPDLVDFTDEEEVPAMDLHEVYDYYMYISRPQADRSTGTTIVIWS